MKSVLFIIATILLIGTTSCKNFRQKAFVNNDIDTLLDKKLEGFVTETELSKIRSEVDLKLDSIRELVDKNITLNSAKFHMITGSFKVPGNAKNYSNIMKSKGYDGNIIINRNGFNMVTARSYTNLRVALREVNNMRENLQVEAWVYISR